MNKAQLQLLWKQLISPKQLFLLSFLIIMTFTIVRFGLVAAVAFTLAPGGILLLLGIFRNPYVGILTIFIYNYFVMGLTRYFPQPLGLTIDAIFVLTYLSLFFNTYFKKVEWHRAKKTLTFLAFIWLLYGFLELFNPLSDTPIAWFYAVRGFSLYFFLTVVLTFILFYRYRDLKIFLKILAWFSLFAALKGIIQYKLGLDIYEQTWLNEIGNITHNLESGLRIFSIFTDAGHFGASMGMSMVIFGILAFLEKSWSLRMFYLTVAVFSCIGMFISGTRGAIAVPFAGIALFILLSKQFKLVIAGIILLACTFIFFKYTTIGEQYYTIRRMRTAFNPQEASLNVRLENQQKLAVYLADKPFGCGIGTSGDWAKRFNPNSMLASIPTDSWYVSIWVEQGIVGLILHLSILFYILIKSCYLILFRIKNKELNIKLKALMAGLFGIMVASYGNGLFGQFPSGIICYMIAAIMMMSPEMDAQLSALKNKEDKSPEE